MNNKQKKAYIADKSRKNMNGSNKGQKPKGCFYCGNDIKSLIENKSVYVVQSNHDIHIKNNLSGGPAESLVSVRYLNRNHPYVDEFLQLTQDLAAKNRTKKSIYCNRKVVSGTMKHMGSTKGGGFASEFTFALTKYNDINKLHCRINILARQIGEVIFPGAVKSIKRVMKQNRKFVPEYLGGTSGVSCEMVQSIDSLVTECHVDLDISLCFSIWSMSDNKYANLSKGWYFLLPYTQTEAKGHMYRGIAICLGHGVGIQWDGRSIFHCSTAPNNQRAKAIGTFFGITTI